MIYLPPIRRKKIQENPVSRLRVELSARFCHLFKVLLRPLMLFEHLRLISSIVTVATVISLVCKIGSEKLLLLRMFDDFSDTSSLVDMRLSNFMLFQLRFRAEGEIAQIAYEFFLSYDFFIIFLSMSRYSFLFTGNDDFSLLRLELFFDVVYIFLQGKMIAQIVILYAF